jgi:hypothetical protein
MEQEYDIREMAEKIRSLRKTAEELKEISGGIPAVDCNVNRILASVKVLEIDINDTLKIPGA